MSNTIRKDKCPSYEYWSKRLGNVVGGIVGKFTKQKTMRRERKAVEQLLQKELREEYQHY